MKKCINCGKIEESSNASVCSACGGNRQTQNAENKKTQTSLVEERKKKRRKKIVFGIFIAVSVVAVIVLATIAAICLFAPRTYSPVQKEKIVSVYAEENCTYGIRADGTVIHSGEGIYFGDEYNVRQISGEFALLDDGTVSTPAMRSDFSYDELSEQIFRQIEEWDNIVQIGASDTHVVGLTTTGSVVAQLSDSISNRCFVYYEYEERYGADDLEKIIRIANENEEYCDVDNWENIIQIAVESGRTLGLKKDGTVV